MNRLSKLVSETRKRIITSDGRTLYDYEYKREGAAELYMCFEPLAGKRYITVTDNHKWFNGRKSYQVWYLTSIQMLKK